MSNEIIEWRHTDDAPDEWRSFGNRFNIEHWKRIISNPNPDEELVLKDDIVAVTHLGKIRIKPEILLVKFSDPTMESRVTKIRFRQATAWEASVLEVNLKDIIAGLIALKDKPYPNASTSLFEAQLEIARSRIDFSDQTCKFCGCEPQRIGTRRHMYISQCCLATACYTCWKTNELYEETKRKKAKCLSCKTDIEMKNLLFNDLDPLTEQSVNK